MTARERVKLLTIGLAGLLAAGYVSIWAFGALNPVRLAELWFLPAVGVFGAIIANTSGTGGGVVFIPVFNALRFEGVIDLSREQIVAASFLIQCFGMSTGALTWTNNLYRSPAPATGVPPRQFWAIVLGVLALCLPTMLATQRLTAFDPATVLIGFKAFSIVLGLALIVTTWTVNRERPERRSLESIDVVVLAGIGVAGGFLTALFSVGVGELIALYLFIRHFPLNTCTATAVIVSAASVLIGAIHPIFAGIVPWDVVALAAPGAIVGGFLARRIAHFLGPKRLKTLDGLWIVSSSVYLIALAV